MDENLFLKECFDELMLAVECSADYRNLDDISIILEANENNATAAVVGEANKKADGAFGHIKKAIDALRRFIAGILRKIGNFFEKGGLSPEKRKEFEEFEKACKADPALAKKVITLPDYKKINAEYEKYIKQAEEAERLYRAGDKSGADKLLEAIKGKVDSVGVTAGMDITCQILKNYAISNANVAKMIKAKIENDERFLAELEEKLGKAETNRFRKDIDFYTKSVFIRGFILKFRNKQLQTAQGCIADVFKAMDGTKPLWASATGRDMIRRAKDSKEGREAIKLSNEFDIARYKGKGAGIVDSIKGKIGDIGRKVKYGKDADKYKYFNDSTAKKLTKQKEREAKGDYSQSDVASYFGHSASEAMKSFKSDN
jgi:hypothetical protein